MAEIGGEKSLGINAPEKGPKLNQGLTVEYDPSLGQEDVPYFVKLDKEKCEDLLKEAGVRPETVARTRILLTRTPNTRIIYTVGASRPLGYHYFEKGRNVVEIYTDDLWSNYVEALRTVSKIIEGKKVNGGERKSLKKLLRTKKLEAYLGYASPERGLEFASKLLLNAVNRQKVSTISHEIKHASENISLTRVSDVVFSSGGKISAGAFGWLVASGVSSKFGGVFTSLPVEIGVGLAAGAYAYFGSLNTIFYLLRPHEIKARSFAKKQENNPKWKNLISITPKNPLAIGDGTQKPC